MAVGGLLAALVVVVVILARRDRHRHPQDLRYRQRPLAYRPLSFDPIKTPKHIRVLRTRRTYHFAECVARYRGRCVQQLELEHYVAGVVVAEEGVFRKHAAQDGRLMGRRLAQVREAWKLQAIAARTYAIYAIGADKYYASASGFHLTDTPRDQAYLDRRDPAIQRAVAKTRGQVLVDRRKRLIYAEYSACCQSRGTWDVVRRRQHIPCHPRCRDFAFTGSTHRRGMCQWGSYLFARQGRRLRWLLKRYYPNARLMRLP